eukprot:gene3563-13639_t
MSIGLLLYVRHAIAPHISCIQTSTVTTGIGNMVGNKGGVAVSCVIAGVSLLLVTSHLAAHDEYVDRRNADYARICSWGKAEWVWDYGGRNEGIAVSCVIAGVSLLLVTSHLAARDEFVDRRNADYARICLVLSQAADLTPDFFPPSITQGLFSSSSGPGSESASRSNSRFSSPSGRVVPTDASASPSLMQQGPARMQHPLSSPSFPRGSGKHWALSVQVP